MADLFDMRIGGAGWHLTSHLIAIAALFVACFAITGYITFRDDSVPITALNDSQSADQDLKINDIDASGNATVGGTLAVTGALTQTPVTLTSADVECDLPAANFISATRQNLGSFVVTTINLDLEGLEGTTTDEIIGPTAANGQIANLGKTGFGSHIISVGMKCTELPVTGATDINLNYGSTANELEDTAVTAAVVAINGGATALNKSDVSIVAPIVGTTPFVYLTAGTGVAQTYTAGKIQLSVLSYA